MLGAMLLILYLGEVAVPHHCLFLVEMSVECMAELSSKVMDRLGDREKDRRWSVLLKRQVTLMRACTLSGASPVLCLSARPGHSLLQQVPVAAGRRCRGIPVAPYRGPGRRVSVSPSTRQRASLL